jgi:hypothetical protein
MVYDSLYPDTDTEKVVPYFWMPKATMTLREHCL